VGYIYLSNLLAVGTPRELKQWPGVTPPGARWLEINSPDSAALLERLHDLPGVYQATIFGQAVHALVDADRSPDDFGIAGAEVHPTQPTLEDVFVALTRAQTENGK
jgi:ABC-2 type transport system ATP-binding protein